MSEITSESRICDACLAPDSFGLIKRETYDRKYGFKLPVKDHGIYFFDMDQSDLLASAEQGCYFCDLLHQLSQHPCSGERKTTKFNVRICHKEAWAGLQEARPVSHHSGRLLDVGSESFSSLKLIEDQFLAAPYLALSHCWGDHRPLTTTSQTLEQRKYSIEWSSLPPVFQDAVTVTRELGVQYLWIDCLCILQDSVRDWEEQAAQMGQIYSNSYVTILAASSPSSLVPFLTSRETIVCEGVNIRFGKDHYVGVRNIGGTDHSDQPLHHRGWAFQEEILSTRIIRFTRKEVKWECQTLSCCECGAHPLHDMKEAENLQHTNSDIQQHWYNLVEQYSYRSLTFSCDKLPAVAGIAAVAHQKFGCRYLAGLWEKTLIQDLAWRRKSGLLLETPRDISQRLPTFSGASVDEGIEYAFLPTGFLTPEKNAIIRSTSIELTGANPFGQVEGGSIVLDAPVVEVNLRYHSVEWEPIDGRRKWFVKTRNCYIDDTLDELQDVQLDTLLCQDSFTDTNGVTIRSAQRANRGAVPQDFECKVRLLSLFVRRKKRTLLVLSIPKPPDGSCERLGLVAYYDPEKIKHDWFENAQVVLTKII
ncbi:heterokaryon incompatibility protein-domain-containing protein [Hyaloscypha finlandica]|nr:heterokaryon incompatibility protein-domain-containing protein [Hyaloscypha finlandica]